MMASLNSMDLVWTVAFSLLVITSIVGNCLVIWIVTGKLRSRNVNIYNK